MKRVWLFLAALGLISSSVFPALALERLEPARGCYLGINPGPGDSLEGLSSRLGFNPAVAVQFYSFPMSPAEREQCVQFLDEALDQGVVALLTLEPWQGLGAITATAREDLAELCAAYERLGIEGIMIRFAHEMNGNWYPWGQQPAAYRDQFRELARVIHAATTRSALVWSPNYGVGYPFGVPGPSDGSADFTSLDTNGDGRLTQEDDMYGPYYPGDDAVDWVGMTLYHWGREYPWLENELPEPRSFAHSLLGRHQGITPGFYARYCGGPDGKPMVIPETAAFFNTSRGGASELSIKQSWWQQVFHLDGDTPSALDLSIHFPKLKAINWFDHFKVETEAQNQWIDWRVTAEPAICSAFVQDVRRLREDGSYFLSAAEARWERSDEAILARTLPLTLPLSEAIALTLQVKASASCDLVIDLLDEQFNWMGGTRCAISAGEQRVEANLVPRQRLQRDARYRWSIFLAPTGAGYGEAVAWHKGPRPVARAREPKLQCRLRQKTGAPENEVTLSWNSEAGVFYQCMEWKDEPHPGWKAIGDPIPGTGGITTHPLALAEAPGRKLFRLQIVHQSPALEK